MYRTMCQMRKMKRFWRYLFSSRSSVDKLQGMFSRRSSSAKKGSTLTALKDDVSSIASLTVNKGVFQKSLTLEEETIMAKVRT